MIGERLKQARLAAGISLRELSAEVGLSHTAIDKFEKDALVPDSGALMRLSEALDVSVARLLRPASVRLSHLAYRRHPGFSERFAARVSADVQDQAERHLEVYDLLPGSLPSLELPDLPEPIDDLAQLEAVARRLRDHWQLGYNPIPDLIDTLEARGIVVLLSDVFEARHSFSGLSAWAGDVPLIIISSEWPGDRQRFTACHELAHLLLHGKLGANIDEEKACDRFAGAFLAPEPSVISALGARRRWIDHRELGLLKAEFGLSMSAWIYRAKDCGVLDSRKAGQLFGQFRKRGWNREEPGPPYPAEEPRRFRQTVFRALAEDVIGESKAMELLATARGPIQRVYADAAGA